MSPAPGDAVGDVLVDADTVELGEALGVDEALGLAAGDGVGDEDDGSRPSGRVPSRASPRATGVETAAITANASTTSAMRGRARTQAWYGVQALR